MNVNRAPERRYGIFLFGLLCLAYLFVTFHRVSPAVFAVDLMRDTGIDGVTMGVMSSVFFLTFGFMQLPSGMLADSLGPRRTLPLFFALAGVGALCFGLSSAVPALMLSRALMGFGVSVVFVCGVKLISTWFPPALFARLNGLYLGMGGVGLILGSGTMAWLCTLLGWRTSLVVCGLATLVIAAAMGIWVRNSPADRGYAPPSPADVAANRPASASLRESVGRIFRSREFRLVAVWFFCHFALHNSFGGLWGGTYLMDVHDMTKVQAGNILNMMGIGMLAGGPVAGWLTDSVFKARKPVMLIYAVLMCVTFVFLGLFGASLPAWALAVWFFCLAATGMGSLCVGFAAMRDVFGVSATGTVSGFLNTFPSIGVVLFQPVTGWLLEHTGRTAAGGFTAQGYALVCFCYAAVTCLGLVAAAALKETLVHGEANL